MPFQPGKSGNVRGRPRGIKEKAPRSFRALAREVLQESGKDVKAALLEGIKGKQSHRYLSILASLEAKHVELSGTDGGPVAVRFIDVDA